MGIYTETLIDAPFADRAEHLSTEEEWQRRRMTSIGGSEAATVLGINAYKSRLALYLEKRGEIEPEDLSDNDAVVMGKLLEEPILTRYTQKSGRPTLGWDQLAIVRHADYPFATCTPDGLQIRDGELGLVQVKAVGVHSGQSWDGEEPPLQYWVQCQHELEVCDMPFTTLVCLIGGQRLVWFDIERDREFAAAMIERERDFVDCLQHGIEPEADPSESTTQALIKRYPEDDGTAIELGEEFIDLDQERCQIDAQIKALELRRNEIDNFLKSAMGPHAIGLLSDGTTYTYKQQTQTRKAQPERQVSFRVLRRRAAK